MTLTIEAIAAAIIKAEDEVPTLGQLLEPGEAVTFRVAGVQGDPGPIGPKGNPGKDGRDGIDGLPGTDGDTGLQGPPGSDGIPGLDGPQGIPGERGLKGDKGDTGEPGPEGKRGAQGPAGSVISMRRSGGGGGGGSGEGAALSDAIPLVESGAGDAGDGTLASRDDHVHPADAGGGAVDSVNGETGVVVLDAGDIPFTPAGTIAATDVQAAIEEVAAEAGTGSQDIAEVLTEGNDAGGQEVTNLGQVTVNPGPASLFGLIIEALAGFDAVYTAFIRVKDEFGNEIFNLDSGGFDQYAVAGSFTHLALRETATIAKAELSTNDASGLSLVSAIGGVYAELNTNLGFFMRAFVPTSTPGTSQGQIYYDDTTGAPSWLWRGKDDAGTDFSGALGGGGLAGSPQTYTESNVTTDRAFNANATSIDELADVLGTLIADLRNRGVVN